MSPPKIKVPHILLQFPGVQSSRGHQRIPQGKKQIVSPLPPFVGKEAPGFLRVCEPGKCVMTGVRCHRVLPRLSQLGRAREGSPASTSM